MEDGEKTIGKVKPCVCKKFSLVRRSSKVTCSNCSRSNRAETMPTGPEPMITRF